jgi:hypothetical protein
MTKPGSRYRAGHSTRVNRGWERNPAWRERQLTGAEADAAFLARTFLNCATEDRGHSSECWIWQGVLSNAGYALTRHTTRHRRVYSVSNPTEDIAGLDVDHLCGQRACMRPDHLASSPRAAHMRRHTSRLTETQVAEVRARHAAGESSAELAAEYGYTVGGMSNLIHNRRWKEAA